MFANLGKSAIWAVTSIIVVVLACVTFLAYEKVIGGADASLVITLILAAAGVTTASHVGGNTATTAVNGALHSALTPATPGTIQPVVTAAPQAAPPAAVAATGPAPVPGTAAGAGSAMPQNI